MISWILARKSIILLEKEGIGENAKNFNSTIYVSNILQWTVEL